MGWKGMAWGGVIGSMFGGPLGALIGAALGNVIEKSMKGASTISFNQANASGGLNQRSLIFCASAAAMLAKMAKADGHVSPDEIAMVERAFTQLGFRAEVRRYAMDVFRRAKDDSHSIYEYATEFARAVPSLEVRMFFYQLLEELAAADGYISPEERAILDQIPRYLGIPAAARPQTNTLDEAYQTLGVSSSDSDDTIKRAYRELAKKYHPDALRAQGLPEEMIGKANEKMGKINAAWTTVKNARHL